MTIMPKNVSRTAGGPSGGVSLSKVALTRATPAVSLAKPAVAGTLQVNLNWSSRPESGPRRWSLRRRASEAAPEIDLDLGCLFELVDGRRGVVQALGKSFGSFHAAPYILLDGDDRSGVNSAGENLYVNLEFAAQLRRILVFAYIYDGVPSFDEADGVVLITPSAGPAIEVRLDEQAGGARTCAIAMLEQVNGQFIVRREVRYLVGVQDALDAAYGWGLRWTTGRKD